MCDVRFTETPSDPTVVVLGENTTEVLLKWNYDLEGSERFLIRFSQVKPGKEATEILKRNDGGLTVSSAFRDRVELKDKATLRIVSVKKDDEGKYRCLVISRDGGSNQDEVQLIVLGKCS